MDYFIMEMWSGIWTLRNTIPLSVFMDFNNSMYIKNNWYFNW